ncbi:MAG: hypothetical protein M3R38_04270 [Actinomycetota bacterium]|nr:hypothetical protein [Actinomycetota bacterium]
MAHSDVTDTIPDEAGKATHEVPFLRAFSARVRYCLGHAGITTPEQITESTREDLLAIPNFGAKCFEEVSNFLAEQGLPPVGSNALASKHALRQEAGGEGISPRTRELLENRSVRTPSELRGRGLREILYRAELDGEDVDEVVTVLSRRRLLPRPAGLGEFLLLLSSSAYVREAIEKRSPLWMGRELDAIGRCLAKTEEQVRLGTLHERALMRFGPVSEVNARFRPPERLFSGFLFRLQYVPGYVSVAQIFRVLESLDVPTLDEEVETLLVRFDERSKDILRHRFAPGRKRPTLQKLGHKYGVTRERVRQIEYRAANELRQECETRPLPRARTAALLVRSVVRDPSKRHALGLRELIYHELVARGLACSEQAVEDLMVVWKALEAARTRIRGG